MRHNIQTNDGRELEFLLERAAAALRFPPTGLQRRREEENIILFSLNYELR